MRIIIRLLRYFLIKLREINENYKYDPFTIAEKFRKQGAKIGENCSIQISRLASEPFLVEIGNNVAIASGVRFLTHDGASFIFRDEFPALRYFGKIVIEDNCFIGSSSTILPGVRIGGGSIVGMKSVVIRDVKPGSVVFGNPAIQVSTVEKYRERCLQEWKKQGLNKFNHLFDGKNRSEVEKIMMSKEYWERLKEHLLSITFEGKGKNGEK
ncbi:MAG: acyltransferase [Desulfobacterales bacterium]|nr:acyltransferase [Desulfobacterales bacterium]